VNFARRPMSSLAPRSLRFANRDRPAWERRLVSLGPEALSRASKLPAGFQRSECLLEHGFLDAAVKRGEMNATIAKAMSFFCNN